MTLVAARVVCWEDSARSWARSFLFPGPQAGAVTQGHSWESDPGWSLGGGPAPTWLVGSPGVTKEASGRTHTTLARTAQGSDCWGTQLVAGRGQGRRLGCASGFGLSGVCRTAARRRRRTCIWAQVPPCHPCVRDTGAG